MLYTSVLLTNKLEATFFLFSSTFTGYSMMEPTDCRLHTLCSKDQRYAVCCVVFELECHLKYRTIHDIFSVLRHINLVSISCCAKHQSILRLTGFKVVKMLIFIVRKREIIENCSH